MAEKGQEYPLFDKISREVHKGWQPTLTGVERKRRPRKGGWGRWHNQTRKEYIESHRNLIEISFVNMVNQALTDAEIKDGKDFVIPPEEKEYAFGCPEG